MEATYLNSHQCLCVNVIISCALLKYGLVQLA